MKRALFFAVVWATIIATAIGFVLAVTPIFGLTLAEYLPYYSLFSYIVAAYYLGRITA